MWGNALERVKALRKRHTVWPTPLSGAGVVCHQDGIRISPTKTGWRHDTQEIVALNRDAMNLDAAAYMKLPLGR